MLLDDIIERVSPGFNADTHGFDVPVGDFIDLHPSFRRAIPESDLAKPRPLNISSRKSSGTVTEVALQPSKDLPHVSSTRAYEPELGSKLSPSDSGLVVKAEHRVPDADSPSEKGLEITMPSGEPGQEPTTMIDVQHQQELQGLHQALEAAKDCARLTSGTNKILEEKLEQETRVKEIAEKSCRTLQEQILQKGHDERLMVSLRQENARLLVVVANLQAKELNTQTEEPLQCSQCRVHEKERVLFQKQYDEVKSQGDTYFLSMVKLQSALEDNPSQNRVDQDQLLAHRTQELATLQRHHNALDAAFVRMEHQNANFMKQSERNMQFLNDTLNRLRISRDSERSKVKELERSSNQIATGLIGYLSENEVLRRLQSSCKETMDEMKALKAKLETSKAGLQNAEFWSNYWKLHHEQVTEKMDEQNGRITELSEVISGKERAIDALELKIELGNSDKEDDIKAKSDTIIQLRSEIADMADLLEVMGQGTPAEQKDWYLRIKDEEIENLKKQVENLQATVAALNEKVADVGWVSNIDAMCSASYQHQFEKNKARLRHFENENFRFRNRLRELGDEQPSNMVWPGHESRNSSATDSHNSWAQEADVASSGKKASKNTKCFWDTDAIFDLVTSVDSTWLGVAEPNIVQCKEEPEAWVKEEPNFGTTIRPLKRQDKIQPIGGTGHTNGRSSSPKPVAGPSRFPGALTMEGASENHDVSQAGAATQPPKSEVARGKQRAI